MRYKFEQTLNRFEQIWQWRLQVRFRICFEIGPIAIADGLEVQMKGKEKHKAVLGTMVPFPEMQWTGATGNWPEETVLL